MKFKSRFFKQFIFAFGCCILHTISTVNSQESDNKWNEQRMKIEIIKMNDKFSFCAEEIDKLKEKVSNSLLPEQVLLQLQEKNEILEASIAEIKLQLRQSNLVHGQLFSELNQSKKREDSLQLQIDNLNLVLKYSNGANELLKRSLEDTQLQLNQSNSVQEKLFSELNQLKKKNETFQFEIDKTNQILRDLTAKNKILEKTVSLTKPHMYLSASHEYYYKEPDFTWKITDLKSKLKSPKFEVTSGVFPLKGYPFSAQVQLTLQNNYFYCALAFKDLKKSGKPVPLSIIPTVFYTMKNPDSSQNLIREINHLYPLSKLQYDKFTSHRNMTSVTYNATNDTMTIAVHVEPPWVVQQAYSYDGSVVWAIDEYRKKREMGEKDLVRYPQSPYFYTSRRGHRVRANMWLNGFRAFERKGLTARVYFCTGPNDEDLKESAIFTVTVVLIHPADPSRNIIKSSKQKAGNREFRIDMATHAEVEKVLVNDTLYYQVTVNPA